MNGPKGDLLLSLSKKIRAPPLNRWWGMRSADLNFTDFRCSPATYSLGSSINQVNSWVGRGVSQMTILWQSLFSKSGHEGGRGVYIPKILTTWFMDYGYPLSEDIFPNALFIRKWNHILNQWWRMIVDLKVKRWCFFWHKLYKWGGLLNSSSSWHPNSSSIEERSGWGVPS